MAADEDDDYMGDLERFIPKEELLPSKAASQTGKGKGGGASKEKVNWKEKRKLKVGEKVKKEAEQRQEGLAAAIPSSNIGFKMLQQMGYKPGIALGKSGQGVTAPISVDVKVNRTGLGRDRVVAEEKVLKAKVKALVQERKRLKVDELREGFQERRRGTWQSRKLVSDYRKAYTALLQLEERGSGSAGGQSKEEEKEKEKRNEKEKEKEKDGDADEEAEEEEEVITEEMLQEALTRLRNVFNYCLYCGFQVCKSFVYILNRKSPDFLFYSDPSLGTSYFSW
ncbi:hypothetical protein M758_8G183900 [Ceratodon purpureus]|uniref:G-patch domain-containing protein n=1 Tax=Ceratodon purpureus TaxID=3225 RepID=A0A8T0H4T7_CERPU|nr:hypothetical protein KC19_8G188500 [Ceratodon purpureus]KAG0609431.1 hypothetical protein M758_8G183900 [Ceratodon purpureus]